MKIKFAHVGPIKKTFLREGFREYIKRIGRYADVETIEVRQAPSSKKISPTETVKKEATRLEGALKKADYKVALAEGGAAFDSRAFSGFLRERMDTGVKELAFIIGGPYGLHSSVTESADRVISLSPMTMTRDLAALLLAEQVYRAFTIIKGEPYSH
ncbi:MAG: 23S rRNA (pseudouridine(1915)-N(3))-methyltransferase RlmH [Thermodesulfobacteriota bacterium]